jgi:hypothetical protein
MMQAILKILIMLTILAMGGFIWYLLWLIRTKGLDILWHKFLLIPRDKHGHFEGSVIGALSLRKCGVSKKWTFIIIFGAGILKECYDKWLGKEKKWDWGDLLADFMGTMLVIILT